MIANYLSERIAINKDFITVVYKEFNDIRIDVFQRKEENFKLKTIVNNHVFNDRSSIKISLNEQFLIIYDPKSAIYLYDLISGLLVRKLKIRGKFAISLCQFSWIKQDQYIPQIYFIRQSKSKKSTSIKQLDVLCKRNVTTRILKFER